MLKINKGLFLILLTVPLLMVLVSCSAAPPPEPAPAAPATISTQVYITSDPPGVAVYGNGEFWGKTPATMNINWASANHNIELRFEAPGYITERRMITHNQLKVHVVLQPRTAAPR